MKGVEEVYHVLLEPGTLGYRAEYTENSKATHKIPLDLALFNGNYQQIVEEMLEFLRALPDCREFPPLYCSHCAWTNNAPTWSPLCHLRKPRGHTGLLS